VLGIDYMWLVSRSPYSTRVQLVTAAALLGVLVVGTASAGSPQSEGTLRITSPLFIRRLDPALSGPLAYQLLAGTCATLMTFGQPPQPEAAVGNPVVSNGGRTYVFTVRRGLRFSDGSALTAANFARALGRVLDPAMRSEAATIYSDIKRVRARGRQLRIDLAEPRGDLPVRLSLPNACPVPLGFPVDPAGISLPVGSGPYYISRVEPFKLVVLERNRHYRGPRPQRVGRVEYATGGELADSIRAVEEGRADVLGVAIPSEVRVGLARRYGVNRRQLFRRADGSIGALILNTSRPLFRGNVALRKAINLALDRPGLVRQVVGGRLSRTPTDQILSRALPGWVDHRLYPLERPDLRQARELAAGNLRGGKAILYASPGDPAVPGVPNLIERNLQQIGLEVEIKLIAVEVINAKAGVPGEPYDMIFSNFAPEYPDPANQIVRLLGGENARKRFGNTNYAYFDVPRYNQAMAAANALTADARLRAFSRLEAEIMRNAAPWAPIFENSAWLLVSKRVGCVEQDAVVRLAYWAVCLR
jgi:peptide/nickel transport system substrate-binding protein